MKTITTPAEVIRRLLLAHVNGDEAALRAVVKEYAEKERRLNHHTLADDLEKILGEANGTSSPRKDILTSLGNGTGNLPRDKERNALLIDLVEPRRELNDLVLVAGVREALDRIIVERRKTELLASYGLRPAGKVLFCGPPGCGKSVAAEALARELCLPLATVRFDAVVSSFLGETAANLRKIFEFGRSRPMVLLFDEFDAIGKERTAPDEHGELKRVVNSFLQLLDGFHAETLTIAATNHERMLDPALWRRFDEIVVFPRHAREEIKHLLVRLLRQMTLEPLVLLDDVVRSLEDFSHADVERVAVEALKQTILEGRNRVGSDTLCAVVERQRKRLAAGALDTAPTQLPGTKPRGQRKKSS